MQDLVWPHAILLKQFKNFSAGVFEGPENSPDINPTENTCGVMKDKVKDEKFMSVKICGITKYFYNTLLD